MNVLDRIRPKLSFDPAAIPADLWIAGDRVWPTGEEAAARTGQLPRRRTTMATTSAVGPSVEPGDTPTSEHDDG